MRDPVSWIFWDLDNCSFLKIHVLVWLWSGVFEVLASIVFGCWLYQAFSFSSFDFKPYVAFLHSLLDYLPQNALICPNA